MQGPIAVADGGRAAELIRRVSALLLEPGAIAWLTALESNAVGREAAVIRALIATASST